MRTWKQGAVGELSLKNGKTVFAKCLKYPLAVFYRKYDSESKVFGSELFYAYLDVSVLKYINRIDELKMNLSDKKISMSFSIDFPSKKITVIAGDYYNEGIAVDQNTLLKIDEIEGLFNAIEKKR